MPRGHLALPKDDAEAIRLFTQDNIIQVRRSGKTGRILEVDHVQFGWMKPEQFYQMKKLKESMPLINTIVEGGYRLKASLWSSEISVEILGTGTKMPMALAISGAAFGLYVANRAAGNNFEAALALLSLFLPFGELWLLWNGALTIQGWLEAIQRAGEGALAPGASPPRAFGVPETNGGPIPGSGGGGGGGGSG